MGRPMQQSPFMFVIYEEFDFLTCNEENKTNQHTESVFVGFSKASGGKVEISENALKQAKTFFAEDVAHVELAHNSSDQPEGTFVGFSNSKYIGKELAAWMLQFTR